MARSKMCLTKASSPPLTITVDSIKIKANEVFVGMFNQQVIDSISTQYGKYQSTFIVYRWHTSSFFAVPIGHTTPRTIATGLANDCRQIVTIKLKHVVKKQKNEHCYLLFSLRYVIFAPQIPA